MSYFDSPLGRCEVVHAMVLVDQTQAECALEHDCPYGCTCALVACFPGAHAGRGPDLARSSVRQ